jgi:hypothetical protein
MIISTVGDDFPFADIDRLNDEEEALPDIPRFPSIFGVATTNKQANVCPCCGK